MLHELISEKGYDKQFAEDTVAFFWSEIRKNLSELNHVSITVRRLGIFMIKPWKVEEFIENYRKFLDRNEAMTFKQAEYRKRMEMQYETFLRIKEDFKVEQSRKLETQQKRKEYESFKIMGEQIQDNGGAPEQRDQEG